jgi:hypothetical protein
MDRKVITAAIVERADRLLVFGIDAATIAARLGITEYVVDVIAGDRQRDGRRQPPDLHARQVRNRQKAVDISVIRMIQRMLAVGILNHRQIAREAGVSINFVTQIATGDRTAVSMLRPVVGDGERFVPESVRCGQCGRRIYVVPCWACRPAVSACGSL